MKRIIRDRMLTPEEAAKYRAIREAIEQEKPEINARIRARLAAKRQAEASRAGESTLGQRIRSAREALGESQVNIAATAGISQGYLSQLEKDEREPTLSIASRLAHALGISLDELASGAARDASIWMPRRFTPASSKFELLRRPRGVARGPWWRCRRRLS